LLLLPRALYAPGRFGRGAKTGAAAPAPEDLDVARPRWGRGLIVAETRRLSIRRLTLADAAFLLRQVNEPSWLANIGDRGVRNLADAERYIQVRMLDPYAAHGFGMYLVERKPDGEPIGLCGLVKRDTLPHPDLGFSLLEEFHGSGYAFEAATAVMDHAAQLKLRRVLAITTPANRRSGKLLEKLGFRVEGSVGLVPDDEDLTLYAISLPDSSAPGRFRARPSRRT